MSYGRMIENAIINAIGLALLAGVALGAFLMWLVPFVYRHLSITWSWR